MKEDLLLEGKVANGVIVAEKPDQLPPNGTRVHIIVPAASTKSTLASRLLKHAGTVAGLPSDLAEQHDHYLHGTPKR